ncbi:hypothetical protein L3X38_005294 [Prunus dulcis]|uniref:Nodulin MtN21 /EamA-like transporter family protein n=1 Tax=Prunus dulcis TaxID=3755 RepID=A0AAD4ZQG7_PRUDU|nr:hypothetical protein L3X38_005294 [Prunus dulcis]
MPFVGMVMVILAQVTSLILNKEAMASRLNEYVLVVYSNALAVLTLLYSLFILNRLGKLYYLDWALDSVTKVGQTFTTNGASSERSSGQLMGLAGLNYASATLSTAMLNLVPAFIYIHTCITIQDGKAKLIKTIGTVVSITGAFVVTIYKDSVLSFHVFYVYHRRTCSTGSIGSVPFFFFSSWKLSLISSSITHLPKMSKAGARLRHKHRKRNGFKLPKHLIGLDTSTNSLHHHQPASTIVRKVFTSGKPDTLLQHLRHFARSCKAHYQDFILAVDDLRSLLSDVDSLKTKLPLLSNTVMPLQLSSKDFFHTISTVASSWSEPESLSLSG